MDSSSSCENNPFPRFSYIDEFYLCDAWKEVTHDGRWCEQDNPRTWERMAVIFNATPKNNNSLCKDRVVAPDELAQMWVKLEPEVAKFARFYEEMIEPVPDNNR